MLKISTAEARNHFSRYLSMVEHQHEKIVVEKRGRKVALIIPFADADDRHESSPVTTSLAALDATPSRSDIFVGIVTEADMDYRDSRATFLLAKYQ